MSDPRSPEMLAHTAVQYEYTPNLAALLQQLGVTLLVSTYQAGKLVTIGTAQNQLQLSFSNFDRCMGLGVKPGMLAVGSRNQIWLLREQPFLASQMQPPGLHDQCLQTTGSHVCGEIRSHELAWAGDELWVINTLFSCLCTISPAFSFVPRWKPAFISALAPEDRCHLNGFCLEQGRPRLVSLLGESDTDHGWRGNKATGGMLIDVPSGSVISRGWAMPHSPRIHEGRLWAHDSGRGEFCLVDPSNGQRTTVTRLPGYTRGLAFAGPFAFIGLSKIRDTSAFSDLPIAERRAELRCAVAVVDLRTGQTVSRLEFKSGVDEIFDIQVWPGRYPCVIGPHPDLDGRPTVWSAPALS